MQTTELFQWVELSQDVPDTDFHCGDQGVIVEYLEPNENTPESGYLLEMFQDGETLDIIAVPTAWTIQLNPLPENPVTISPEIMSGTPIFRGTRVPIQTLFDHLKAGDSINEFLEGFPSVTKGQILQLLDNMAAAFIQEH